MIGSKEFTATKSESRTKVIEMTLPFQALCWILKRNNVFPTLTWSVGKSVPGYSNISKRCLVCLIEKVLIATYENPDKMLNKKSKLMAKCHHNNKLLLSNYKSND